ncbi:MAG: ComF family protein [Clostridiales bacterium]|nr:ComF family protein [Clostridiales bacterium]
MKVWSYLVDLIAPMRCPFCDRFIRWDKLFCSVCLKRLPFTGSEVCRACGKVDCICKFTDNEDSIQKRIYPHYDRCIVPLYYDDIVKHSIIDMKYNSCGVNSKAIAEIITRRLKKCSNDNSLLVCVPMTRKAKIARGYNQSHLISKNLSSFLGIEYDPRVLRKNRNTKDQKTLTKHERALNLLDAFTVAQPEKVMNRDILLCDDVLTTGNTLNECARVLKLAGARTVTAVVFATVKGAQDNENEV